MKDLLPQLFKRAGYKVDNAAIAQHGFFVLQGIFAGIAMNDIWRVLQLPGNNVPLNVAGVQSTFDYDWMYQMAIAIAIGATQILFKLDHAFPFAVGITIGSTWANQSEKGNYIGTAAAKAPSIPPGTPQVQPSPIASSLTFQGPYSGGLNVMNSPMTSAPAAPYNPLLVPPLNRPTLT